jgi:hypothetical protein
MDMVVSNANKQIQESLDPAVAIGQKPERFVESVVPGSAEDVQHHEYYSGMNGDSDDPTPPLRRHTALVPLSREHMSGLIQARDLVRASSGDETTRRRAVEAFLRVWDTEIRDHFDDEERLLLPLTREPAMRERLLTEHRTLRGLAGACRQDSSFCADPAGLLRLGTLLQDHIRWEERMFFEAVQRDDPRALDSLSAEAAKIEAERPGSRARHRLDIRDSRTPSAGSSGELHGPVA